MSKKISYSIIGKIIDEVSIAREELGIHDSNQYCFYRGQQNKHSLLPSILREGYEKTKENNIYCDSWTMGAKELLLAKNSWEVLASLQHYGIPTRLLDWTTSLINAIFFSIEDCKKCKFSNDCCKIGDKSKCNGNPCIWVFNPLNMHYIFHGSKPEIASNVAITIGLDEFKCDYYECFCKTNKKKKWPYEKMPVFLEMPWKTDRIRCQSGYFTFHPSKFDMRNEEINRDFLRKIDIDKKDIPKILEEIRVLGITEYDIYPELPQLGNFFKRKFS